MNRLRTLRARAAVTDPLWKDAAIALLFIVGELVEAALLDAHGESRVLTGLLGVLLLGWIALRRRATEIALCGFAFVAVAQGVIGNNFLFDASNVPFVAVLFLLYSAGRYLGGRWFWPVLAVFTGSLLAGIAMSDEGLAIGDVGWVFFTFGLPVLTGRALRSRLLLQRELREKAEQAEGERLERARRATEAERDRIASELQAVVANGVSAAGAGPAGGAGRAAPRRGARDRAANRGRSTRPGARCRPDRVSSGRGCPRGRPGAGGAPRLGADPLPGARPSARGARRPWGRPSHRLPGLRDRVSLYGGHLSAARQDGAGFRLRARLPLEEVAR
jgi:signal transduction histidine kinase